MINYNLMMTETRVMEEEKPENQNVGKQPKTVDLKEA